MKDRTNAFNSDLQNNIDEEKKTVTNESTAISHRQQKTSVVRETSASALTASATTTTTIAVKNLTEKRKKNVVNMKKWLHKSPKSTKEVVRVIRMKNEQQQGSSESKNVKKLVQTVAKTPKEKHLSYGTFFGENTWKESDEKLALFQHQQLIKKSSRIEKSLLVDLKHVVVTSIAKKKPSTLEKKVINMASRNQSINQEKAMDKTGFEKRDISLTSYPSSYSTVQNNVAHNLFRQVLEQEKVECFKKRRQLAQRQALKQEMTKKMRKLKSPITTLAKKKQTIDIDKIFEQKLKRIKTLTAIEMDLKNLYATSSIRIKNVLNPKCIDDFVYETRKRVQLLGGDIKLI
ncbi:unnamed protein product [Didymodactylos carnosus]|uniref:Uncharacterized protein n=1 Tax=Didymodactylos carnosus TaxID=1234261 RepID=A0A814FJF6_9BILA|nr:unnamed protein product [Didymodactylos carnosus]CAF3755213.1 unnamed protein product [Didymodactylos carnosus]